MKALMIASAIVLSLAACGVRGDPQRPPAPSFSQMDQQ